MLELGAGASAGLEELILWSLTGIRRTPDSIIGNPVMQSIQNGRSSVPRVWGCTMRLPGAPGSRQSPLHWSGRVSASIENNCRSFGGLVSWRDGSAAYKFQKA